VNDIVEAIRRAVYDDCKISKLPEISIKDMIPEWVIPHLPVGIDIENLASFFQKRPPMWIRAQTNDPDDLFKRLKTYGFTVKKHEKLKNSICIENARVNLYTIDEFKNGLFEIQDLASQIIGLVCNPAEKQRWWDACAGAGGKTLQLADMLNRKGTITATDIREYKLDDLRIRARRAGFPNIMCAEWNGKALRKKKQGGYDGVLVDSPCSCSGTWRRNPDARWTMQPSELQEMPELQFQILSNASSGVKVGGILVYATCSFFKEENSDVVERFLEADKNFELSPFLNPLNNSLTNGMLQVYPWDGNCDAMFVARFIRKNGTSVSE
jgi:16S rRNA (cytosine967-C5)-methyltransferase